MPAIKHAILYQLPECDPKSQKIERQAVNKLKRNTEVLNIVQFEQQLTQFIQLLQSVQFVQGLTKNERNSA